MSKQLYVIIGMLVWLSWDGRAIDRADAVADMEKRISEIGVLLENNAVVFPSETMPSTVLEAVLKAIDPAASILTPEEAERRQEEEKGIFYGVGLKLTMKDKWPKILEVTKNGPAESAGAPAGAIIEKIDDQNTEGMPLEDVVKRLRGHKDEVVSLTVRPDEKSAEPRQVKVTRAAIQMPVTGTTEQWPQQIGYLKINGLYEGSGSQIATQLKTWAGTNCVGLILDMRGANGMNFDAVAEIASLFSHATPTLFTVKDGFDKVVATYQAKEGKPLRLPAMILVDRDTQGAAETMVAVLQNCQGVMLIGVPTSGDDRIREPIPMANGNVLYIALKRIDMGKDNYDGKGVKPDILIAQAADTTKAKEVISEDINGLFSGLSEQEKNDRALIARIGNDAVLRRATDILLGLKALDICTH